MSQKLEYNIDFNGKQATNREGYMLFPSFMEGDNEAIGIKRIGSASLNYVLAMFKIPTDFPITRQTRIHIDASWNGNEIADKDLRIDIFTRANGEIITGMAAGSGDFTSAVLTFAAGNAERRIVIEGGVFTNGINAIAPSSFAAGENVIIRIDGNSVAFGVATFLQIIGIWLESA